MPKQVRRLFTFGPLIPSQEQQTFIGATGTH